MPKYFNFLGFIIFSRTGFAPVTQLFNKFHRILKPGLNFKIPFI